MSKNKIAVPVQPKGFFPEARSSCCGPLFATIKKNMRLKISSPCSACVELFLPVLLVIGFIALSRAIAKESFDASTPFIEGDKPFDLSEMTVASSCVLPEFAQKFSGLNLCDQDTESKNISADGAASTGSRRQLPASIVSKIGGGNSLICSNTSTSKLSRIGPGYCVIPQQAAALYARIDDNPKPVWRTIPNLQDVMQWQWIYQSLFPPRMVRGADRHKASRFLSNGGGRLRFTPQTAATQGLVEWFNETYSLFGSHMYGGTYATLESVEKFVKSRDSDEERNWGIIHVKTLNATNIDIDIRFNNSMLTLTEPSQIIPSPFIGGLGEEPWRTETYYFTGFMSLQQDIVKYWRRRLKNETGAENKRYAIVPMPYKAYTKDSFLNMAGRGFLAVFIVMSYLYAVSQLVKGIVHEKEMRIREAVLIMGLRTASFYASWFITYFVLFTITAFLSAVLMKASFFRNSDFFGIFFLLEFFVLSIITLSGFISTIFSKARTSAMVAPIIFFIISMPLFVVSSATVGTRSMLMLLSPCALAEGLKEIARYELEGGMKRKQIFSGSSEIPVVVTYFMLMFDALLYGLLMLYLDSVLPSEWGTRRGVCCCITRPFNALFGKSKSYHNDSDGRDTEGVFENSRDDCKAIGVSIRGLRKEFSRGSETFVAVNDLHFDMMEDEVTVLLGHNGAGKTTAINLITGMMEADSGDCLIYDRSVRNELNTVRQDISFCPQHNILWDDLTCYQHLDFYAGLKGVVDRSDAINTILTEVDLAEKINVKSSQLSGGQKRKLSVAIAFVGGSRFVLLDEPTAGMDVGARRSTWDLIRKMSLGRCILLTTHYMDEADLLGRKVCIMSRGSLKAEGSSAFLKEKLSVGYKLAISVESSHSPKALELHRHVMNIIPESELISTGGVAEVLYRIPTKHSHKFSRLLAPLESRSGQEQFGVHGYGITVTTLEEVFLKIAEEKNPDASLNSSTNEKEAFVKELESPTAGNGAWLTKTDPNASTFGRQLSCLFSKRFSNARRDRRTVCLQILLPVVCVLLAMLLLMLDIVAVQPRLEINSTMYKKIGRKGLDDPLRAEFHNCPELPRTFSSLKNYSFPDTKTPADFEKHLSETYGSHGNEFRFISAFCGSTGNDANSQPVTVLAANYSSFHSYAESLGLMLKLEADNKHNGDAGSIKINNYPMPLSERQEALFDFIRSWMISLVIMIPFTLIPSTYVGWLVKEKEVKAKHLQFISGMKFASYWCSNFLFDVVSFIIIEILVLIIFFIFDRSEYVGDVATFFATFLVFLFFGLSSITSAYAVSFLFSDHSTAQTTVMLISFVSGFMCSVTVNVLRIFDSTKKYGDAIAFVFRIIPSFCLGDGLLNLSSLKLARAFGFDADPWAMDTTGWDLVYMSMIFPLCFIISLLLDHPARMRRTQMLSYHPEKTPPQCSNEDADVAAERERLESESADSYDDYHVVVRSMHKVYANGDEKKSAPNEDGTQNSEKSVNRGKLAVKNLTFGVKKGEVFGFLGTNGAGKTTTISILCGEQLPTGGRGYIAGYDVVEDTAMARLHMGYCPQFDALFDLLTAAEHIRLYAGLRGLPTECVEAVCSDLIDIVGLKEHQNTLAGAMSGGNKRKLSVAISLIGNPTVVFLDEPSAGMDPQARRGLWNALEAITQHSSIVLTTHHLEEIEALAHRLAIMKDGELKCIGDKTHLKEKFGDGYELNINMHRFATDVKEAVVPSGYQSDNLDDPVNKFRDRVLMAFPGSTVREQRSNRLTFALPVDVNPAESSLVGEAPNHRMSQVFKTIEQWKKNDPGLIEDYSIAQASLESVFLRIVKDSGSTNL